MVVELMNSAVVPEGQVVSIPARSWVDTFTRFLSWGQLMVAGKGGVIFFGANLW